MYIVYELMPNVLRRYCLETQNTLKLVSHSGHILKLMNYHQGVVKEQASFAKKKYFPRNT